MKKYKYWLVALSSMLLLSACIGGMEPEEKSSATPTAVEETVPSGKVEVDLGCSYSESSVDELLDYLREFITAAEDSRNFEDQANDRFEGKDFEALFLKLATPLTQTDADAHRLACEFEGIHLGANAKWESGDRLSACNVYQSAYERSNNPGFNIEDLNSYVAQWWSAARAQIALGHGVCQA